VLVPRRLLATALAGALALALAACGPTDDGGGIARSGTPTLSGPLSQLDVLDDPAAYEGPTTAIVDEDLITPISSSPRPELPTTVTSHDRDGAVDVTVSSVDRILAVDVAGSLANTVYGLGLGDRLVGRDTATDLPGTEQLPLVTSPDGQTINAETILGLAPSVIVTDGTVGPVDVVQQLRQSGIPVVFVSGDASFAGARRVAEQVGAALGVPQLGTDLGARIEREVAGVQAQIDDIAPPDDERLRMVFMYLRGSSGIYYLFGSGSGADALIEGLHGVDAAADIAWTGMRPMTDEAIVAMDPDVILVMTGGLESVGGVDGLLDAKPAIALTSAGERRRFVDMADAQVLSFGPRSAEVLEALARAIYAP
jgi:iron complex transport system substrate-binding protein